MVSNNSYSGIDISKIIASVLVLCIHIHPLFTISPSLSYIIDNGLARLAVPFFFVSSGFLFFRKVGINNDKKSDLFNLKKYILRILTIYLIWSIIYFPFTYMNWTINNIGILKNIILYIRDIVLLGSYGHLWYFPALIFAIILVYFFEYKFGLKKLIYFSIFTYTIGFLYTIYGHLDISNSIINKIYNTYNSIFITNRNGLFFGVIFITIGYIYSKNERIFSNSINIVCTVITSIMLIIESLLHKILNINGSDIYIMLVPATFFIFGLILELKIKLNKKALLNLRNLSTLIYTSQYIYINLISYIDISIKYNTIIYFNIVLAMCILFGEIIIRLSEVKYLKFLKYLY